jgi:hypothetical protein
MGLASPSIGSRGAVALKHRTGLPAGQAHQVRFATAFREPLVRERVSQPVGVEVWQAGLVAASLQHLRQPRGRQPALLAEPQPVKVRLRVTGSRPQVAVQRQCRRSAERQCPLAAALAETSSTSRSKSTSESLRPANSPLRAPVSSSSVMMAVSRRASKSLPAQAASSRSRPSSGTIGTAARARSAASSAPSGWTRSPPLPPASGRGCAGPYSGWPPSLAPGGAAGRPGTPPGRRGSPPPAACPER